MNLGLKIKALIEGKNFSREQMIELLPMSINTYKKIEYGDKIPTLDELKMISEILQVDPAVFLKDDATSIINHGSLHSGVGNLIVNEKEILLQLITSINTLSKTVSEFTQSVRDK
jgi:transcriptional regulator with XRE-family HTH domain